MPPDTSVLHPATKPTLTSLPLDLLGRILRHICDDNLHQHRSFLRKSNCCLFHRYFEPQLTIDGVEDVHAPFSKSLLAPALASPVLAAAINQIVELSYLTDLNTEGKLSLWLRAFAPYVHAVSPGHIAEQSCASLSTNAKTLMVRTLCHDTIQLFKTITVHQVKLNVLDLAHVPFEKFEPMHHHIIAALCATLESTQNTLHQLALPVYCQFDLCPRALEMVTLSHLELLSVELKNAPDPTLLSRSETKLLRLPFLRIMQAIEGHADRIRSLTTLTELKFINVYCAPCRYICTSGCSPAFFHAITTLRASFNPSCTSNACHDILFFDCFDNLKSLYWSRKPPFWDSLFQNVCKRLQELHLCHPRGISGLQVGTETHEPFDPSDSTRVSLSIHQSYSKIVTLVTRFELESIDLDSIPDLCPKLECLSLIITSANVELLRDLIVACPLLTALEIAIAEKDFGPLRKAGWQTLGKAFSRYNSNLSEVAIQMKRCTGSAIPVGIVTDCFVNVVKQIGSRAVRLVFRAFLKTKSLTLVINAIRRVVDACKGSLHLTHLEVGINPRKSRITSEDVAAASEALMMLRNSTDALLEVCGDLGKIDFGCCHRYVQTTNEI